MDDAQATTPRVYIDTEAVGGEAAEGLLATPTMTYSPYSPPSALKAGGGDPGPTINVSACDGEALERLWPRDEGLKAVFLDYDGTLREFEDKPEHAVPTQEIHKLLDALEARDDLLVHIISGRDANFLKTHFGEHHRVALIAEHERRLAGRFEVWSSSAEGWLSQDAEAWKRHLRPALDGFVESVPGSRVEEKASSLVWHFRGVADDRMSGDEPAAVADELERIIGRQQLQGVKTCVGHKMVEVACRQGTKGAIVQQICAQREATYGAAFKAVLVAGDDVSDEPMFEAAPPKALTIKVGSEDTHARFRVDGPDQLRDFLTRYVARE
mmetsp:Transcript_89715/g.231592  ORF Transcript_89715/g.231592 Transcript_89715/m.231592 type:complete len:326 (-) Transcript_89715:104-1081(-)